MRRLAVYLFAVSMLPNWAFAEQCSGYLYQTADGMFVTVKTREKVPEEFKNAAKCLRSSNKQAAKKTPRSLSHKIASGRTGTESSASQQSPSSSKKSNSGYTRSGSNLVAPQDITLQGTIRREEMSSSIGKIHLRWPRSVEGLFGRTPVRAMAEAGRTVSRTLRQSRFPRRIKKLDLTWQVVFLDEQLSETQIPRHLISNCHPGWMTPPSNIYVVAQRVAAGCGSKARPLKTSVADDQLARVLVHEIGHAVEFQFLGRRRDGQSWRAEGFAKWFERHAARHSSMLSETALKRIVFAAAKEDLRRKPYRKPRHFDFDFTALSYARASMYIEAVVQRTGVGGLSRVYKKMAQTGAHYAQAVRSEIGWTEKQLNDEVNRLITKAN